MGLYGQQLRLLMVASALLLGTLSTLSADDFDSFPHPIDDALIGANFKLLERVVLTKEGCIITFEKSLNYWGLELNGQSIGNTHLKPEIEFKSGDRLRMLNHPSYAEIRWLKDKDISGLGIVFKNENSPSPSSTVSYFFVPVPYSDVPQTYSFSASFPTRAGTYVVRDWKYTFSITAFKTRSQGTWGHLYYQDKELTAPQNTVIDTPVGKFIFLGGLEVMGWGEHGWFNTHVDYNGIRHPLFQPDGKLSATGITDSKNMSVEELIKWNSERRSSNH